jgi:hypothetical protein
MVQKRSEKPKKMKLSNKQKEFYSNFQQREDGKQKKGKKK